jgi:hypothetical protein
MLLQIRRLLFALNIFVFAALAGAKEPPAQIIDWPGSENTILRFSIGKIQKIGTFAAENSYAIDTTVENLSKKAIPRGSFTFYLYDKSKARIGEGTLDFNNLAAGEILKIKVTAATSGTPVSLSVVPLYLPPELQGNLPPKTATITIYSVPSGADLKVDGQEFGMTPIAVRTTVGSHTLEFSKEGYNKGTFPLVISPDQLSGGSVSYELGVSAHDTVELRDGTVLTADVESLDATSITMHIAGNLQKVDRNQVKRILLIPREAPTSTSSK